MIEAQILNFISEQTLELSPENVEETVILADFLDIRDVIDECSDFMISKLTVENVIGVWQFSQAYSMHQLQDKSFK